MVGKRVAARLIFPVEALDSPAFRAMYEQVSPRGEQQVNAKTAEITYFHAGARGGPLDSLERLLINAGLPYNLYCNSERGELLHYWRPGMRTSATTDHVAVEALKNPGFILSVRRACAELVYGQSDVAFGR